MGTVPGKTERGRKTQQRERERENGATEEERGGTDLL